MIFIQLFCFNEQCSSEELYNLNKKFGRLDNAIQEHQMIQPYLTISCIKRSRISNKERKWKKRNYSIVYYNQTKKEREWLCKEALMEILSVGRSKLETAAGAMLEPDEIMKEL